MIAAAKLTDSAFLIRVDDSQYLFEMGQEAVTGTTILSAAAHFTYLEADQTCQQLRKRGHSFAVVCNSFGDPVSAEEIHASVSEDLIESPSTGLAPVDWALVGAASSAEMPAEIAKRLGISVGDLAARMSAASEKFDRVITAMRISSRESSELTKLNREEFEERKQSTRR